MDTTNAAATTVTESKSETREKSPSSSPERRYSKSPSPSQKRRSKSASASPKRRKRTPSPKSTKVCISKVTRNVNKAHVEEIFLNYGKVKSVDLPVSNGISRGIAYVDYDTPQEAEDALKYMNGGWIDGQEVSVQLVQPQRLPPLRERRRSPPPRIRRRSPLRSWRGNRRSRSRSPRRRRSVSPRNHRRRKRSRSDSAGSR